MWFIGDVHGKTNAYIRLLKSLPAGSSSLQIGDMGLGFSGVGLPPPGTSMPEGDHEFIRGNHDSPLKCQASPFYAGEYGIMENGVFYLGGAWSIDKMYRIEDVSWWRDEEQSIEALNTAFDLYVKNKPQIVATHEAPAIAAQTMLSGLIIPRSSEDNPTSVEKDEEYSYYKKKVEGGQSRTSQALQRMFETHEPEHWVFGHYHVTKNFEIGRTKFHCLAELDKLELDR